MKLELTRYAYLDDMTLGRIKTPEFELQTIERPWKPNTEGLGGVLRESCVPDGDYSLIPHSSERFPGTFALVNEALGVWYQQRPPGQSWGRTAILIHVGNFVQDVVGCIAVGVKAGTLNGRHAVLGSKDAMGKLNELLGRQVEHGIVLQPARTEEIVRRLAA